MARPSRYQPDFARQARGLCRLGADNAGLARYFSVSPATLYRWLNAHPAFAASVAAGRAEAADPRVPTRYERATGYACRTARVFAPRGPGDPVIAYYTRRIPADPKAALRWLRN
jgi:transposase-like protein